MSVWSKLVTVSREIPRVWPLMRDARVPWAPKVAAVLAAVLIISPLDIFGDIPVLGLIDDAALLAFVVHLFVRFSERALANSAPIVHNVTPGPSTAPEPDRLGLRSG